MRSEFITIDYNTHHYPFQHVLAKHVFKVPHLDKLHEIWRKQKKRQELSYQDNLTLRSLMQKLPDTSPFYRIYHRWIARVLAPHFANRISYSSHPKMRVHLAQTECVSDFHRDVDVTGRVDQVNCYLPFTDVFDSCTLWVEMEYGAENYSPVNLKYGQALLWDGGKLKHGTVTNTTNCTRVSCDFRFSIIHPQLVQSPWKDILAKRPLDEMTVAQK